ncbi:MAG: type II secretion system minor pseudopilin GspJ [Gammaproteobacteria bacterium]
MPRFSMSKKQRGFTLLEILVAAFITGLMLITAYTTIAKSGSHKQRLEARYERLQEIQLAMRLLTIDIAQIQPRPVRDIIGQSQLAAVMTAESEGGIEMTVGGYKNPLNLQRSQQQRIGYELEEDKLFRSQWQVLDRTQGSLPFRRQLLTGVNSLTVRFMNRQLEWSNSWPQQRDGGNLQELPIAIEVTIEVEEFGVLRRIIEVAG